MNKHVDLTQNTRCQNSSDEAPYGIYEAIIGLEVHCQLKTVSKLFCGCATKFGSGPNQQTCPVCLALPGALPVLNHKAVDYAIRMALAVNANIRHISVFSRKQYFYPDLPKGYQISQHDLPFCEGGGITLQSGRFIRLRRIHLEEDAGKSLHVGRFSQVDLNRAGVPLIEIVSEPDMRSPEEASEYFKRLHNLVQHIDVCDGNMEEGSLRCDVNVSVRKRGLETLNNRCEIKNLNSFRNIERALNFEISRQIDIYNSSGEVKQETLHFDADLGRTWSMRSKEDSHDYRYMPEPDLGPLLIDQERIAKIRSTMPELPEAIAKRYQNELGLNSYDAHVLTSDRELAGYFEAVLKSSEERVSPKLAANWILTEYLREVRARGGALSSPPITARSLSKLLLLIEKGTISGKIAKAIFQEMLLLGPESSEDPQTLMTRLGLIQVSDDISIRALVKGVLVRHPKQWSEYREGKEKLFGFFVGQIMREGQGKLNPSLLNKILREELGSKED